MPDSWGGAASLELRAPETKPGPRRLEVWIDGPCLLCSGGWSTTRACVSRRGLSREDIGALPHPSSLSHFSPASLSACSSASACLQVVPDQLALLFQIFLVPV